LSFGVEVLLVMRLEDYEFVVVNPPAFVELTAIGLLVGVAEYSPVIIK
jgi:hypothetical protein